MCGRFEILTYDEIADVVAAVEHGTTAPRGIVRGGGQRAQARPGSTIPLVATIGDVGVSGIGGASNVGELEVTNAIWGFEAGWNGKLVFNTRIESALQNSGMWHRAIREGRCIIPVASFFEAHDTETTRSPRTGKQVKRAYRFSDPSSSALLLAGVSENGRCSIVTCEPNRWVAPVHRRMPLALRFEEVPTWLGDEWPALADRSAFELAVAPEQEEVPGPQGARDQLSLF